MGWLKLDTGFFMNPKALAAGRDGRDLYLSGLCWSAGQETDGDIPAHALSIIATLAGVPDPDQTASRLVEVGLWGNTPDGWVIHSYGEWQTTRAERDLWRNRERERKQRTRTITKTSETDDVVREMSQRDTARNPRGIRALEEKRREEKETLPHHPQPPVENTPPAHTNDDDDDDDDDDPLITTLTHHTTDPRPHQALKHIAALLARQARQPGPYANAIIRTAAQLPDLQALATTHPNDTPTQLANRYLTHTTPPPPPTCHHCHALTHTTTQCPIN